MYHLVSKEGNVHRLVASETKAEALVAQGYSYVEEPAKPPKKAPRKSNESGKAAGDTE